MTQDSCIAKEFPEELPAIIRLRSQNPIFAEICEDLELLGRDLVLFSQEERLGNRGAYLDVQESFCALRRELVEFLHSKGKPIGDL